jgi:hypothetical protein
MPTIIHRARRFMAGYWKWLLFGALVAAGCSTVPRPPHSPHPPSTTVYTSDDVRLDHDQILVCAYNAQMRALGCMSPEEARIRMDAAQDGAGR